MSTSEKLMRDLAARNPIRDTDIRDSTGGQRRSLARAWTDTHAEAHDATSTGVLARRDISPRRRRSGGLLLVAASVVLLIGGTSAVTSGATAPLVDWVAAHTADEPQWLTDADLSGVSEAQASEIEDGMATEQEYRAAYHRFQQCMGAAGFELPEDPAVTADGTFSYSTSTEAQESGVDMDCYEREFVYTDMMWQSPDGVDHPSNTQRLRDCLEERGVAPEDTYRELDEQLREERLLPADCRR